MVRQHGSRFSLVDAEAFGHPCGGLAVEDPQVDRLVPLADVPVGFLGRMDGGRAGGWRTPCGSPTPRRSPASRGRPTGRRRCRPPARRNPRTPGRARATRGGSGTATTWGRRTRTPRLVAAGDRAERAGPEVAAPAHKIHDHVTLAELPEGLRYLSDPGDEGVPPLHRLERLLVPGMIGLAGIRARLGGQGMPMTRHQARNPAIRNEPST